uniref:Vacuolar protein-sorting-associated protein 37 homolog 2 isoform X1 n=1 Tax=Elaeis guineensis var. tenera TaxID=51953 RepID=A0A8N4F9Q3_ELAGV|nr:vacuolar protein-sorting-associated protein 37 homolog 2 isoform X1 [Elaeis guineensis]XP_029124007.1 vacuolar protein-sorting-associated protein 37 homolog 2 isoform X1 [Elaeis guineensis]XP_029124008.1 vacuolar protein-sorting-associated protein 37 homolog 2 isoform X1 [Elaeis guineensis]XP_029124009.1 vacuolar protein-sorting-associated protein 37 homolog 2 isoform X1 [Elaeis guineensis]
MMNWRIPIFGGAQQQQSPSNFPDIPTQSWYPPSVVNSPSRPATPTSTSGVSTHQRASERPQSPSQGQPSPSEAAGIITCLKDKSINELRKLLTDKEAYNAFFNSLDQVKIQNNLHDELRKETLQLTSELLYLPFMLNICLSCFIININCRHFFLLFTGKNLEQEPRIQELKNQSTIIRTTELAAAHEKLLELEREKEETLKLYSPASLLQKLHGAMNIVEEESEMLHRQLLDKEIDLQTFIRKYKKLRTIYHKRALLHLAAKTSVC